MKLRLIEQACGCSMVRGGGRLKVCAHLCLWHLSGECLPPRSRTCRCLPLFVGAAMKLRLIEQACSCGTVQGGGGLNVRAHLYLWHLSGECLPPRSRTCRCLPFGWSTK